MQNGCYRVDEQEELQAYVIERTNTTDMYGDLQVVYLAVDDPVFDGCQPVPGWWLCGEPRWINDIGEFLGETFDEALDMLNRLLY